MDTAAPARNGHRDAPSLLIGIPHRLDAGMPCRTHAIVMTAGNAFEDSRDEQRSI
jgi:hypothetical protein